MVQLKSRLSILICSMSFLSAGAQNPIIQTKYTSDPAPYVHGDTVYLFVDHDNGIRDGYDMTEWLLYTSTDMVNWTDHGPVASLTSFGTWASSADNGAWAAQAVERDGKWYMYCPIQLRGIGVLSSDSPYGPWSDPKNGPIVNFDIRDIDPTVFIDDDGQAYLYWGNNGLWYAKLTKTMTGIAGKQEVKRTTEAFGGYKDDDGNVVGEDCYEEAPWIYKRDGHYYLVYAAGGVPEHLSYSMSDSPTGPWVYKGKIMDTPEGSFTTHPGVIDYKGHSYIFYHSGQLAGGNGFRRSVCVQEFKYNADGTIPEIAMTRRGITDAVGHLDALSRQEAETMAMSKGVRTVKDNTRGVYVDSIDNSDYVKVTAVAFGDSGASDVMVCVKTDKSPGKMEVRVDDDVVATIEINGLEDWTELTAPLSKQITGIHDVMFRFRATQPAAEKRNCLFFFDYWQFQNNSASGIRSVDASRSKDNAAYNLQGMRINLDGYKGVYIMNNKKYIK